MELFLFRLFPKDSDEVIEYQGERTLEALSKFIDSNGKEAGKLAEEVSFFLSLIFRFLTRIF